MQRWVFGADAGRVRAVACVAHRGMTSCGHQVKKAKEDEVKRLEERVKEGERGKKEVEEERKREEKKLREEIEQLKQEREKERAQMRKEGDEAKARVARAEKEKEEEVKQFRAEIARLSRHPSIPTLSVHRIPQNAAQPMASLWTSNTTQVPHNPEDLHIKYHNRTHCHCTSNPNEGRGSAHQVPLSPRPQSTLCLCAPQTPLLACALAVPNRTAQQDTQSLARPGTKRTPDTHNPTRILLTRHPQPDTHPPLLTHARGQQGGGGGVGAGGGAGGGGEPAGVQ
eukprot:644191-Rhodomonas_salina.2